MLDGARNALLGYLYQLLGTAAIRIREVTSATDTWATILAQVGRGHVVSEEFGQDATIHPSAAPKQGVTAIQFKYSGSASGVVGRDDLIEILCGFDRSRREAEAVGVRIDRYLLVTNRSLDAKAEEIFSHRTSSTPHPSLKLVTARKNEPVPGNVSRLIPYNGERDLAANAWHSIMQAFEMFTGETFEADLVRLRCFASRYGVLEHEWENRLNSLVGAMVRATAQGGAFDVTYDWLKTNLIGDSNALNLQFGSPYQPHISAYCLERLTERARRQHRIRPEFYLERQIQQDLAAELEQHPVVFVAGGGGRGKSLAVLSYLLSIAGRQVVWSEGAAAAGEEELVGALTVARLPGRQHGGSDRCLHHVRARLDVANGPGPDRPLWTIDLDGIDEAPDRYSQIRELINLCWAGGRREVSPASLVVTCRSPNGSRVRECLIGQWLDMPEPVLAEGVSVLHVGDFIDNELLSAARLLNGAPEQRIIRSLSTEEPLVTDSMLPVPDEVLQTLRHPVVWGGYATLPEHDRHGILDQQSAPLIRLAAQLHDRFLRRCRVRRRWRDERMLECALPMVARTIMGTPPYRIESWDQACELCLDRTESRDLYAESLSYGIIERDGRDWRWGHPFLAGYLATTEGGHASE